MLKQVSSQTCYHFQISHGKVTDLVYISPFSTLPPIQQAVSDQ